MKSLQQEIQQTRPFDSRESEAYLNLVRTHETVMRPVSQFFREYGLTQTLYNVLRIIRGAGDQGAPGALGTAEAIYAYLFGLVGISQGSLICVLQRLTFLVWAIVGAVLFIRGRRHRVFDATGPAEAEPTAVNGDQDNQGRVAPGK